MKQEFPAITVPNPLTLREQDAVAMLQAGLSFAEAMDSTGLTFDQVEAAWKAKYHARPICFAS